MFDFELGFHEQVIVMSVLLIGLGWKKFPIIPETLRKVKNTFQSKTKPEG